MIRFFKKAVVAVCVSSVLATPLLATPPLEWSFVPGDPSLEAGRCPHLKGEPVAYRTTVMAPSGETLYLGLENVHLGLSYGWEIYKGDVVELVDSGGGALRKLKGKLPNIHALFPSKHDHKAKFLKGYQQWDPKKIDEVLGGVMSGTCGMDLYEKSQSPWFAYVSNQPIEGYCGFGEKPSKVPDLNTFIDNYGHIVMSVTVFEVRDKPAVFEHRGIFKNPAWLVHKDKYKGIALLLHAFAATAYSQHHPKAEMMGVEPDGNDHMRSLLLNAFSPKDLLTNRDTGGKFPVIMDPMQEGGGWFGRSILIKPEAWKDMFRTSWETSQIAFVAKALEQADDLADLL